MQKKFLAQHKLRNENAHYFMNKLNAIDDIRVIKPTSGTTELGWDVYPVVFEPEKFGGLTKEEFYRKLNEFGIPTCDNYPPLHSLNRFKEINIKKGIYYTNANWGYDKSNNKNFLIVSDIYLRSVEFPHEILIASKDKLDWIVESIKSLK